MTKYKFRPGDHPIKRNFQQHYVTAAYLAGFTPDGDRDSQLFVYERKRDRFFKQKPDEAAKRRNFYSVPLTDGTYDDSLDKMITALEGQAMPVIRKLSDAEYELTLFERGLLSYLIAFQELRTPWARKMLHQLNEKTTDIMMKSAAQSPGVIERAVREIEKENGPQSISAAQLRDAILQDRIVPKAEPHAGIDEIKAVAPEIGNIYAQMQWAVLKTSDACFVTSDAPVVRRDPGDTGGMFGGGLYSPTVEVWFPLSKQKCLFLRPDNQRINRFFELLQAGETKNALDLQRTVSPVIEIPLGAANVDTINAQTIVKADRFESPEIAHLLKGESQNVRLRFFPE